MPARTTKQGQREAGNMGTELGWAICNLSISCWWFLPWHLSTSHQPLPHVRFSRTSRHNSTSSLRPLWHSPLFFAGLLPPSSGEYFPKCQIWSYLCTLSLSLFPLSENSWAQMSVLGRWFPSVPWVPHSPLTLLLDLTSRFSLPTRCFHLDVLSSSQTKHAWNRSYLPPQFPFFGLWHQHPLTHPSSKPESFDASSPSLPSQVQVLPTFFATSHNSSSFTLSVNQGLSTHVVNIL